MKIEIIKPNPLNFNVLTKEEYDNLKTDIKKRIENNQRWFTKKIVIRSLDDGFYELIDGHQKLRVCEDLVFLRFQVSHRHKMTDFAIAQVFDDEEPFLL